jgi:putative transcriptional regulator
LIISVPSLSPDHIEFEEIAVALPASSARRRTGEALPRAALVPSDPRPTVEGFAARSDSYVNAPCSVDTVSGDPKVDARGLVAGFEIQGHGVVGGDPERKSRQGLAQGQRFRPEQANRHAKGEITLKTTTLERPNRPPEVRAADVTRIRLANRMSRAVFARLLNVSPKTVQSWEHGTRKPSQAALRLIQVLHQNPSGVFSVVGISAPLEGPSTKRKNAAAPKGPLRKASKKQAI